MREQKLNEVTDEYRRKYGKELDQGILRSCLSEQERGELGISKVKQMVLAAVTQLQLSEHCSH